MFNLPDDLYQHQKEDLDRLLSTEESMMNLSEMGVGKTPIAIGLATKGGYRKALVICPKTLRLEWARQIKDWTGEEPDVSRRGSTRRLETLFNDMLGKGEPSLWFIVNYDTFRTRRHLDILNLYPFDLIIMDEVHRLRNESTTTTRGIMEFLSHHKNSRVLCMTGSPIVNRPEDLHTILEIVRPQEYNRFTRSQFESQYTNYDYTMMKRCRSCGKVTTYTSAMVCTGCGSMHFKPFRSKKLVGVRGLEELRKKTEKFTIRRTKEEVLKYLPEKYYRRVMLDMGDEQRELYDSMEKELFVLLDSGEPLWAPGVLAQLTRLRQLNVDPKILGIDKPSAKTEFIQDLINENGKLVIFSTFEKYVMYLHYNIGVEHITITGSTPVDERIPMAVEFNKNPNIRVCLATIGPSSPGGEGLTLTGASNVVFADRWWTPTTNSQGEDRLHRITQKNSVQVILPIIEDSIDESFDKILEKKKAISEEYLGEQGNMQEIVDDLRRSRQ